MSNQTPAFSGPKSGRFTRHMNDLQAQLRQTKRELEMERGRNKLISAENETLRARLEESEEQKQRILNEYDSAVATIGRLVNRAVEAAS